MGPVFALDIRYYVLLVISFVVLAVAVYALVHAARQRADAFTAVEKLTKGKWVGIIVASIAVLVLFPFYGGGLLLSLVGTTAVCVYLADVRPKVDEVQRGPRW